MSTISTTCTLCGDLVDLDETRDNICIDCLWKGFRLVTFFEQEKITSKHPCIVMPKTKCLKCGDLTMFWYDHQKNYLCTKCAAVYLKEKTAKSLKKKKKTKKAKLK